LDVGLLLLSIKHRESLCFGGLSNPKLYSMNFYVKLISTFLLLCCSLLTLTAQPAKKKDWALVKEAGKTTVYTRANKASKIKEVRIKTKMDVDFDHFIQVLGDVSQYDQWVYKSRNPKLLDQVGENEMYYFIESDFPFPLTDRDMVIHSQQWLDPISKTYTSKSVAKPAYLPKHKKMVRIPMLEAYWKIWPRPEGGIEIDYRALADPGGNLPAWLVNMAITQGPIKTMRNLEQLAKDTAPRPASDVADK